MNRPPVILALPSPEGADVIALYGQSREQNRNVKLDRSPSRPEDRASKDAKKGLRGIRSHIIALDIF